MSEGAKSGGSLQTPVKSASLFGLEVNNASDVGSNPQLNPHGYAPLIAEYLWSSPRHSQYFG